MIRSAIISKMIMRQAINQQWRFMTTEGERKISALLKGKFPKAANITVTDISGGCGAMYEIIVESIEFEGITRIQQHRQVHEVLKAEIKEAHGVRIHTTVPG